MAPYWSFHLCDTYLNGIGERKVISSGYGDIIIQYGKGIQIRLSNVHYIPLAPNCIFSPIAGTRDGLRLSCRGVGITQEKDENDVVGYFEDGIPVLDVKFLIPERTTYFSDITKLEDGSVTLRRRAIVSNERVRTISIRK